MAGHVEVVVEGQDAALVKVAILNDFVDGEVLAELGNGQNVVLGLGLDLLVVDTAHVVPGLALTAGSSLDNFNFEICIECCFNYSFYELITSMAW